MNTPVDFIKQNDDLQNVLKINNNHVDDYYYTEILDKNRFSKQKDVLVNHRNPSSFSSTISSLKSKKFISNFYNTFIEHYNPFLSPENKNKFSEKDVLFPGIRYMTPGIVVFERPPAHHVISVSHDYRDTLKDDTPTSDYYIPIPWQVYVCEYNPADMRLFSVRMFFTESSLTSLDQTIYTPPIFNFYSNGTLCRPFFGSIEDIEKYPQNISGIIASAFDWVWNSGFNYDITDSVSFFLGNTKGHLQFENYIPENLKPSYQNFSVQRYNPFSHNISRTIVNSFYKYWEMVPLEVVSSFKWNPVSSSQSFWFSHFNDSLDSIVQHYAQTYNLVLVSNECDHSCHCDDCCDDDGDIADCRDYNYSFRDDNSVTYSWIQENVDLSSYFSTVYINTFSNNLLSVIEDSISLLNNSGISPTRSSLSVFNSFHNKISSLVG